MPRYVALLRGVTPMNANMGELRRCFEQLGYSNVKTVLASGNVVFDAGSRSVTALERAIEAGMAKTLDRSFATIVRSQKSLQELVEADPFSRYRVPAGAKRVVTFLRRPQRAALSLPLEMDGATIFAAQGAEVFTAYVPGTKGPSFMVLIEKTFGKDVTTRTWDTVTKCATA